MKFLASIFIIFILLFSNSTCQAMDTWLCTEESSLRQGNSIYACGVGTGKDENQARVSAFEHAKHEFQRICSLSYDCKGHEIDVFPKRTTCERGKKQYRCYRLIVFNIGSKSFWSVNQDASKSSTRKTSRLSLPRVNLPDTPDVFKPFVYEDTLNLPKLKKGMSKKNLLAEFGAPYSVDHDDDDGTAGLDMNYNGKMCVSGTLCDVYVEHNKVMNWRNFKPIYTEDLK